MNTKTCEVGLWISDYKCWKCKKNIEVLVGIKIDNEVYSILSLSEMSVDFINKYFPNTVNLRKNIGIIGNVSNYCPYCKSTIGNFYIYDDIYLEVAVTGLEDFETDKSIEVECIEAEKLLSDDK